MLAKLEERQQQGVDARLVQLEMEMISLLQERRRSAPGACRSSLYSRSDESQENSAPAATANAVAPPNSYSGAAAIGLQQLMVSL